MSEKCDAKEKTDDKTSFGYGQPFILFLPLVRNSGLLASNLQKPRRGTLHTRSWLLELINSFMKRHAPLPAYRFACLTHLLRALYPYNRLSISNSNCSLDYSL